MTGPKNKPLMEVEKSPRSKFISVSQVIANDSSTQLEGESTVAMTNRFPFGLSSYTFYSGMGALHSSTPREKHLSPHSQ